MENVHNILELGLIKGVAYEHGHDKVHNLILRKNQYDKSSRYAIEFPKGAQ